MRASPLGYAILAQFLVDPTPAIIDDIEAAISPEGSESEFHWEKRKAGIPAPGMPAVF